MKQKFLFLLLPIFIFIGLAAGFSAQANTCPTDNGSGVGCLDPSYPYYCGGQCRGSQSQCPTWTPSPVCASGFSCANFAAADSCGYGATCSGGYTRCSSWPNYTCISTVSPISPCNSYDTCAGYCTGCIAGYNFCSGTHACIVNACTAAQTWNSSTCACVNMPALRLGYDSVSGNSIIQSATYSTLYIPSSGFVGIGTTTPTMALSVVPASGYSILAGNFKIGNVALPTVDADAATKGYVDSTVASATSSLTSLWGGTTGGNIWNLNSSGNVGIGTTTPGALLHVQKDQNADTMELLINGGTGTGSRSYMLIGEDNSSKNMGFGYSNASYNAGTNTMLAASTAWAYTNAGVNGLTFISGKSPSYIRFAAGGFATANEKMRITSTGYVGIGTTGPKATLSVGADGDLINMYKYGSNTLAIQTTLDDQPLGTYGGDTENRLIFQPLVGNVGIGTTNPQAKLEVVPASGYSILAGNYKIGNVALPTTDADAATKGYVDTLLGTPGSYLPLAGGTMTGAINMGNNNISNVNTLTVTKLTATTIDPLYTIKGINYSTFAPSVAGGVKEEYIGKIKISKLNAAKEYEAVIDFANIEEGSDLWVWHQVIDFSKDSVDVVITPYGKFAQVYYVISNNKLIFRSDRAVEISYRLIAKRFDWRDWPTRSEDQTTPGVKIRFSPLINLNNLINKLNIRTFQIF